MATTRALSGASTPTARFGGGPFCGDGDPPQQHQQNSSASLFENDVNHAQGPRQQQLFGLLRSATPAGPQQQPPKQWQSVCSAATSQQSQQQQGGMLSAGAGQEMQSPMGLIGSTVTASQPTSAGGLFGNAQCQQTQASQVSAVQISYDNLRPRTRFDDLSKLVQDELALIDKGIHRVIRMRDEIGAFLPQHLRDVEYLACDVRFVESKFRKVQVDLNGDIWMVKVLQDMAKKNIANAQLSFKATDNLKLPVHYHQSGLFAGPPRSADLRTANGSSAHVSARDLITYFNRVCDEIEKYMRRLDEYRCEIERDMPGVENGLYEQIRMFRDRNSASGGAVKDQLSQVLLALRETGSAVVAQAGHIADTRERLSRLQAGFIESGVYGAGTAA